MPSRIADFQKNVWGSQAGQSGIDAQRADLWLVDMSNVTDGVRNFFPTEDIDIEPYFAKSVSIPEMRVKAEMVRRDSRAYMMPGFDDPMDAVKIVFLMDARSDRKSSKIYRLLNLWRKLVRSGRGPLSSESEVALGENYRINYAFPINLALLRGSTLKTKNVVVPSLLPPFTNTHKQVVDQGFEISQQFVLRKAWLSAFKLSDLSYESGTTLATIDATIYAEDVLDSTDPKPVQG